MLYVNLVEDRLQQKRTADTVLALGSLILILLLVGLGGTLLVYRAKAGGIQAEISKYKKMTADIQAQADTAKVLQDQIGILAPVEELAQTVHATSVQWCRVLNGVGMLLPPGVNLNEISSVVDPVTQARRVRLRGLAGNKELVSAYIEALNELRVFDQKGTMLTDLGTQSVAGSDLANFSLELLIAGTAVKKEEPKKPAPAGGEEAKKK